MIQHAVDSFGRLDCPFNSAADPSDIDIERFNAAIAVRVGGVLLGMKHAAPIMMRQQSGSIINTASVNGTRAGYTTLTGCTATACGHSPDEIRGRGTWSLWSAGSLSPGPVTTGMFGKAFGIDPDTADSGAVSGRGLRFKGPTVGRSGHS
jgi:NAD(P)-dependent dehydrogenase (short-subunit alcohol dehydrogenase family)